jgi:hypothetical protein
VFYLDVACVYNGYTHVFKFFLVFATVSDVCYKCFSHFGCTLQVFHQDVAKVDMVLHMLQWDAPAASTCYNCWGIAKREQTVSRAYMWEAEGARAVPYVVTRHVRCLGDAGPRMSAATVPSDGLVSEDVRALAAPFLDGCSTRWGPHFDGLVCHALLRSHLLHVVMPQNMDFIYWTHLHNFISRSHS